MIGAVLSNNAISGKSVFNFFYIGSTYIFSSSFWTIGIMSLILWSQILLRNSSDNFCSDISHPNLVVKSDNENSDHILSGIWAISVVQRIRLNASPFNSSELGCWLLFCEFQWSISMVDILLLTLLPTRGDGGMQLEIIWNSHAGRFPPTTICVSEESTNWPAMTITAGQSTSGWRVENRGGPLVSTWWMDGQLTTVHHTRPEWPDQASFPPTFLIGWLEHRVPKPSWSKMKIKKKEGWSFSLSS